MANTYINLYDDLKIVVLNYLNDDNFFCDNTHILDSVLHCIK